MYRYILRNLAHSLTRSPSHLLTISLRRKGGPSAHCRAPARSADTPGLAHCDCRQRAEPRAAGGAGARDRHGGPAAIRLARRQRLELLSRRRKRAVGGARRAVQGGRGGARPNRRRGGLPRVARDWARGRESVRGARALLWPPAARAAQVRLPVLRRRRLPVLHSGGVPTRADGIAGERRNAHVLRLLRLFRRSRRAGGAFVGRQEARCESDAHYDRRCAQGARACLPRPSSSPSVWHTTWHTCASLPSPPCASLVSAVSCHRRRD
jgi:hypothetical protein